MHVKVRNFAELAPNIRFSEFDFMTSIGRKMTRRLLELLGKILKEFGAIHSLKMHKMLFGVEAKGEGDSGGGLVRYTERALRPKASQGPDEADGNHVHLLRYPHGKRGSVGGQDRAESTEGGLVKRKYAHRKALPRGTAPLL